MTEYSPVFSLFYKKKKSRKKEINTKKNLLITQKWKSTNDENIKI